MREYSLSPNMHNAVLRKLGLLEEFGPYEAQPLSPEELERWMSIEAPQRRGFSVTMPHKEAVYRWMKKHQEIFDETVDSIGAVNTVKVEPNRLVGFNTDRQGFFGPLREKKGPDCLKNKRALLLGAGGAARAITISLESYGAAAVMVWNRDFNRAKQLVEELKKKLEAMGGSRCEISYHESLKNILSNVDLLVNATPVGMKDNDPSLIDPQALEPRHWVYDIVYWPRETKLIKAASQHSCEVIVTGDRMLAHQGAEAFRIWFDELTPNLGSSWDVEIVKVMQKALDEHFAKQTS